MREEIRKAETDSTFGTIFRISKWFQRNKQKPVLWIRTRIRIHRIHMFLGLPDTDPDPLVRGMDPDPDSSIIMQIWQVKPWFLLFCASFWLFIFENDVNVASKSNRQKKIVLKICFLLASWRSMTKTAGSGSRIRIRIHWSEAWIHGSGSGSTPKCHGSATMQKLYIFSPYQGRLKFFKNICSCTVLFKFYTVENFPCDPVPLKGHN